MGPPSTPREPPLARRLAFESGTGSARTGRCNHRGPREGAGGRLKCQVRDHGHVFVRVHAVLPDDPLEHHLRYSAGPGADDDLPLQVGPLKVVGRLTGHEERAVHCGQLSEGYEVITGALQIDVHGRLGTEKADVHAARDERCSPFVGAECGGQFDVKAFVAEKSEFERDILRSVEQRPHDLGKPQALEIRRRPRGAAVNTKTSARMSDSTILRVTFVTICPSLCRNVAAKHAMLKERDR